MSIREAVLSDVESLAGLYEIIHATYEDTEDPFDRESIVDFLNSTINSSVAKILVFEKEENIVGICTFFIFPVFFNKHINHSTILTIWVSPEFRGNGIGALLINKCEEISRELKATKLIVGSHHSHEKTNKFFKKSGMRMLDNVYIKEVA